MKQSLTAKKWRPDFAARPGPSVSRNRREVVSLNSEGQPLFRKGDGQPKTTWPATAETTTVAFGDDHDAIRRTLRFWAESSDTARLVSVDLCPQPDARRTIDGVLERLAFSLKMLWPQWYADRLSAALAMTQRGENPDWSRIAVGIDSRRGVGPPVSPAWLSEAVGHIWRDQSPPIRGNRASVARQMRLALSDRELWLALFIESEEIPGACLLSLCRASEWLATATDAAVLLVLRRRLRGRSELDAVNYWSIRWPPEGEVPVPRADNANVARLSPPPTTDASVSSPAESPSSPTEEQKHWICPMVGKPHPASLGEQLIAAWLHQDPELSNRFRFNWYVTTRFHNRFLVDLVWPAGGVVVEIDGYRWHSTPDAFYSDRQRDYELTLSGYLVLRLPHDFVVQDPALAGERIREFVRFRESGEAAMRPKPDRPPDTVPPTPDGHRSRPGPGCDQH